ncbi:sigma factor binding protein 1, chloroplastic-like [Benincasa hispida]|uniref:sigma factor binding protein 1, chloroplastic-like n=1 Tax=Benincasa hispida TaxID=102211 RepID=UPI001900D856|nr:sigma factor binding protein 1, chloroplastic-like [Benincasa hispida]
MNVTGKKHPKRSKKSAAANFKVVYISSPMKVKTSASKFRSLVQKLTGQDSDAERFMELIASAASDRNLQSSASAPFLDYQLLGDDDLLVSGKVETAAYESSVAALPPLDDLAVLQNFDASFAEMFHGFWYDSSTAQTMMPGLSALL